MNDVALNWLAQQINLENAERAVWCADENSAGQLGIISLVNKPFLVTNRYDVADQAKTLEYECAFNDFDFSQFDDNSLNNVYYRVSKEKPIVHHIINSAYRILAPGGKLFLCGLKNEGIKTYIEKAAMLFNCSKAAQKNGATYSSILIKNSSTNQNSEIQNNHLDASDYATLRLVATTNAIDFFSKPGLFGWNKIDQGSEFLIEQTLIFLPEQKLSPRSLLDLGCGYGYLSLMTKDLDLEKIVLTDNNAAALIAARFNCDKANLPATIVAADCGDQIDQKFDLILCNPPFHQGFSVDGDLTLKFIRSAKRLLHAQGIALFVVNQFIPLERKSREYFRKVDTIADNGSFKVVALRY